jgi:hypothetical protein
MPKTLAGSTLLLHNVLFTCINIDDMFITVFVNFAFLLMRGCFSFEHVALSFVLLFHCF